jgi:hypothetical protein
MVLRKALWATLAGGAFALGSSGAMASAVADCSTITTIGAWASAGTCVIGDKAWEYNSKSDSLSTSAKISFTLVGGVFAMEITGFDTLTIANTWKINYTISVLDPAFHISDMFAGADNPGGGSLLHKDVTGDATFSLDVKNGVEDAGSEKHGLTATTLTVDETFSVLAGKTLLSVSDTFEQTRRAAPVPGTLALLGLGLVALGAIRRTRRS